MSNSLINTAMSGLNAAQVALSTVSNNISNYNVAGYNRQTAILAQNGGMATMSGFIGNGVTVTSVNREYNQFITNQLRGAQSAFGRKMPITRRFHRSTTCWRARPTRCRPTCRTSSPTCRTW